MSYSCLRFLPEIIFSTLEQGEETQAEHTELKKKNRKKRSWNLQSRVLEKGS